MNPTDSIPYFSIESVLPDTSYLDSIHFTVKPDVVLPKIEKKAFIGDWSVILIIFILVTVASIRISSEKYLYHLTQSIFNQQTSIRLFRERVFNIMHPAFRLEILFYLSTGLFFFHAEKYYLETFYQAEWLIFVINTLAITAFINVKYFAYSFNGFLFNVQNEISEYIFYSRSGNRIMGLFLFPIAILLFFFDGIWVEILLILGILILLLFSVISLFKGLKIIAQKDFSIYYLILYLCSLEILPLLVVWRILWRM